MLNESSLRVAAGSRVVPPATLPCAIAGHGPRVIALSEADPLEINAALLVSGDSRCLMMAFDLLYIGGALETQLRADLAARYGLESREVLLFASHTHFAPPTDPTLPALGPCDHAYAIRIRETAVALAGELLRMPPSRCQLQVRRGQLAHSINRRRPRLGPSFTRTSGLSFDGVTFAPYEQGLRDDTATLVSLTDEAHEPLVALWHYACHPVGHTPSNVTSADFAGAARSSLRQLQGAECPVLFLQGFCADIRPNIPAAPSAGLYRKMRDYARTVITGTPPMQSSESAWRAWVSSLTEQLTRVARSPAALVEQPTSLLTAWTTVPGSALFDGSLRTAQLEVRSLKLGAGLELVMLGAEPCIGWQKHLAAALGEPEGVRLFAGYCGDVFGYLPLPEQLDEGGYEVTGFQPMLGMRGRYRKEGLEAITAAVSTVVRAVRA